MRIIFIFISTAILWIPLSISTYGQEINNPDKKFGEARELAFDGKRKEAIQLSKRIVEKYPGYSDVWILIGRIYSWEGKNDSASVYFEEALEKSPSYEDAYVGYLDNLFWAGQYDKAEIVLDRAFENLKPPSSKIEYRKAKLAYYRESYGKALRLTEKLYEKNPKMEGLLSFIQKLKRLSISNAVGLLFDHDSYDGQIAPWQTYRFYGRKTIKSFGSVIGRVTHSNRFGTNGNQFELDAYPSLGENSYAYLNVGFSKASFFPDFRFGGSIYWNLPKALELDIGYRNLKFTSSTHIFTASLGKYTGNWWLNLRGNHVPSQEGGAFSGNFQARYYFKGAEDFFSFRISSGISADEEEGYLQRELLGSYGARVGYQQLWSSHWMGFANIRYSQDEISSGNFRPNFNISVGSEFRF
ncbi:YaiO family outer membrane beta-barrel protein [Echinicola jeungdonensis]|uniref:YaiO family outer membrane beta-barrel protein n=1 Tax=Echinicola jeungdonensis TaxID=709343 RepID=A0ABV5J5D0_9BACT|nr:YaiO family outer membrane beta-barrel protein [Echinicola jeungdonensis]MDN3670839.1 YaiO family outer membrane beta-barrel protein [Echinicola jeungdonensis]